MTLPRLLLIGPRRADGSPWVNRIPLIGPNLLATVMTDNLTLRRVVAGFGATVATTFTLGCMAVEDPKTATGMDLSIALASLVVALVSVVIAFVALRRTRQSEDKRRKLEVAAHLNHYYGDAKKWANCVIDKLTEAAFLCEHDPMRMQDGEFFKQRNDLRSELSALVDKGRLLLPNEKEKVIGLWKEGAYRGLRQEALDVAVSGYELVTSIDYNDHGNNTPTREQLISCKRQFASVMQSVLDVRKTAAEVRRLANEIWHSPQRQQ